MFKVFDIVSTAGKRKQWKRCRLSLGALARLRGQKEGENTKDKEGTARSHPPLLFPAKSEMGLHQLQIRLSEGTVM